MRVKILVTGASGNLGSAIVQEFASDTEVLALTRAELDITDDRAVAALVRAARPSVIINCAAYNDVDGAEDDPAQALRVNALAVLALARAAADVGAVLVHYSTDFVFDGTATQPYTEEDAPNPRSVYATSKLLGEWLAKDAGGAYVLRVESLFGGPAEGKTTRMGSAAKIVGAIKAGDEVRVFSDRTVSPSYAPDVARATRAVLERQLRTGLYHCVNSGSGTWYDLAEEAGRLLGLSPRLKAVTLASVQLRAARPQYCVLSNVKLAAAGVAMPTWQDALARYVRGGS